MSFYNLNLFNSRHRSHCFTALTHGIRVRIDSIPQYPSKYQRSIARNIRNFSANFESVSSSHYTDLTDNMPLTPPTITTDISNYADTGYGDPHRTMKALTWQSANVVKLSKFCLRYSISHSLRAN
jgi:hypothetical protein